MPKSVDARLFALEHLLLIAQVLRIMRERDARSPQATERAAGHAVVGAPGGVPPVVEVLECGYGEQAAVLGCRGWGDATDRLWRGLA